MGVQGSHCPVSARLMPSFRKAQAEADAAAMPTVAPNTEVAWRILAAVLHLGNAAFVGNGEDDAQFADGTSITFEDKCRTPKVTKHRCTFA